MQRLGSSCHDRNFAVGGRASYGECASVGAFTALLNSKRWALIAEPALQGLPECLRSSDFSRNPWTDEPRGLVAHMLAVTAFQFRNPVLFIVLTESHDASLHGLPVG